MYLTNKRGAASNTIYIGTDSGYILGPTLAGFIITAVTTKTGSEISGYQMMYLVMILPVAVALGIFLLSRKRLNKKLGKDLESSDENQAA